MNGPALERRLRHALERRLARLKGRRILHVLHVGKTGGTALKAALAGNRRTRRHHILLHRHNMRLHQVPGDELAIFFLRDPITRFVSGFNSRLRKGQPRTYVEWSAAEARAFARFRTADELASSLSAPDRPYLEEAERAMGAIQHVKDHYSRWLGDPLYLRRRAASLFFIGRQERLEEDFEELRRRLELDGSAALPDDPVAAHVAPRSKEVQLSPEAQRNLKAWYQQDYRLLKAADELAEQLRRSRP